jgi:hypothetical protein
MRAGQAPSAVRDNALGEVMYRFLYRVALWGCRPGLGGGIIPEADIEELTGIGVAKIFTPVPPPPRSSAESAPRLATRSPRAQA